MGVNVSPMAGRTNHVRLFVEPAGLNLIPFTSVAVPSVMVTMAVPVSVASPESKANVEKTSLGVAVHSPGLLMSLMA